MNDVDRSLRDIQASPEHLRKEIVHLSKHGYRRSRARGWATKMRFLVINQLSDMERTSSTSESGSLEVRAHSSSLSLHVPATHKNILQVARRSALKDASAYVAVSYCWNRAHPQWSPSNNDKPLQVICENLSSRPTNAPSDVLNRSIAYAEAQNINAIWIDQECIDQSDPVEKEMAIQEMDMVYEESNYPIAVLEFSFQTQIELDVFASICDMVLYTFDPSQIEVLESVLEGLVEDTWFERAWTLQESVSAGAEMKLLLGCPGLQKSPDFGLTSGEFELSVFNFQNAMVNARVFIEEGLAASVWSDSSSAINASNCADVLWNYIPAIISNSNQGTSKPDAPYGRVRNAAQALTFLENRYNSYFPDRLAILANLCDYEYRINTEVLKLPNSSFTVCSLTLAVLNGDMSLLVGHRDEKEGLRNKDGRSAWILDLAQNRRQNGLVYQNDDDDLQSNTYGFSWGPKPSACLQNITYLEEFGAMFRLRPATLSMHGLRVCGTLWDVNCAVKVPKTRGQFASKWQEEVAFQIGEGVLYGLERQKPLVQDFFWFLLHELIESGFCELSRTLWNFVQPVGKAKWAVTGEEYDSMEAPLPYSYDMIFGHLMQSSAVDQHLAYDEQEVRSRMSAPHLGFDPENEAADRPILERLLIEQVCRDGVLICAAPLDVSLNKQPYVWFEACKMGDQIFTPVTNVSNGAARSRYRNQAMSWRVLATGQSADDCKVLHCLGRRRGVWRLEGLEHQDYTRLNPTTFPPSFHVSSNFSRFEEHIVNTYNSP